MATTADGDEAEEEEAIEEIAVEANEEAAADTVKAERMLSPTPTPTLSPLKRTQTSLPTILQLH